LTVVIDEPKLGLRLKKSPLVVKGFTDRSCWTRSDFRFAGQVQIGDRLISVNGIATSSHAELRSALKHCGAPPFTIVFCHGPRAEGGLPPPASVPDLSAPDLSAPAASETKVCAVCSMIVPLAEFEEHVTACVGLGDFDWSDEDDEGGKVCPGSPIY
jgi:hypothetical protein